MEKYLFFNSRPDDRRRHTAEDIAEYWDMIVESGIKKEKVGEPLIITSDGNDMVVKIGKGRAIVGGHAYLTDGNHTLTVEPSGVNVDRIDRIVLRLDYNDNTLKTHVKQGGQVEPPTLQRDEIIYELSLAQVHVRAGKSYIGDSDITDERGDDDLSPYATSEIIPNYNDDTLQSVLNQVQQSNQQLSNHMLSPVLHTFHGTAHGANAKTINLTPAPTSLVDCMAVVFKNAMANTGAVTLNVNGLGAKPLVDGVGNPIASGDLIVNIIYTARYNASTGNFILQGSGGGVIKKRVLMTVAVPSDKLVHNVALPSAFDTSKSIVKISGQLISNARFDSSQMERNILIELTGPTTITLSRLSGKEGQFPSSSNPVVIEVIEFFGVKSVQRGKLLGTGSNQNIAINQVNPSKSMVNVTFRAREQRQPYGDALAYVTNSINLVVTAPYAWEITWELIEFI